jgi:hypothetical protein
VLGTVDENNTVTLLSVEQKVLNGLKVGWNWKYKMLLAR